MTVLKTQKIQPLEEKLEKQLAISAISGWGCIPGWIPTSINTNGSGSESRNLVKRGEIVGIQTATLWIYHVHPAREKHAGNHLHFISQQ